MFDNKIETLNKVSPSFCLAKWQQVTIHLESGTTHSCHHPNVHKIPLSELRHNPTALHNTQFKKKQRQKMLNGKRPKECSYCWSVEDLDSPQISDRYLKSMESWAWGDFNSIKQSSWRENIKPRSMEVSFSRACNLKCSYCSANFSTQWQQEIKKYGPYRTGHGKASQPFYEEEKNPYVDAFWRWWPELKSHLKVFRITGGEPLLSASTFKVIESLIESENLELEFAVNSNLSVPSPIMDRFLNLLPSLVPKVKEFMLFTSLEAWGNQAEYIRFGLNLERMMQNIESYLSADSRLKLTFMSTFNALSLPSYQEFLTQVLNLRKKYPMDNGQDRIFVDISFLQNPKHQSLQVLNESWVQRAEDIGQWMKGQEFTPYEILKYDRAIAWMKKGLTQPDLLWRRADFYHFFRQHDQRRGTDFYKIFPELTEFMKECERIAKSHLNYQIYSQSKAAYQQIWRWYGRIFNI